MRIKAAVPGGIALLLLAAAAGAPAVGQEVLHAPGEIRACLCQEQALSALARDVQQQKQVYDERQKALAALESQVRTQRPLVDPMNYDQREAFAGLLDQRQAAAQSFADEVTPFYAAIVGRYNDAVGAYNGQCAGKAYDPDVLAQVRGSLACPKP